MSSCVSTAENLCSAGPMQARRCERVGVEILSERRSFFLMRAEVAAMDACTQSLSELPLVYDDCVAYPLSLVSSKCDG